MRVIGDLSPIGSEEVPLPQTSAGGGKGDRPEQTSSLARPLVAELDVALEDDAERITFSDPMSAQSRDMWVTFDTLEHPQKHSTAIFAQLIDKNRLYDMIANPMHLQFNRRRPSRKFIDSKARSVEDRTRLEASRKWRWRRMPPRWAISDLLD